MSKPPGTEAVSDFCDAIRPADRSGSPQPGQSRRTTDQPGPCGALANPDRFCGQCCIRAAPARRPWPLSWQAGGASLGSGPGFAGRSSRIVDLDLSDLPRQKPSRAAFLCGLWWQSGHRLCRVRFSKRAGGAVLWRLWCGGSTARDRQLPTARRHRQNPSAVIAVRSPRCWLIFRATRR